MKLRSKLLTVLTVAVTGTALAVLPMATSNAAEACAGAWNSTRVYNGGDTASQSGHNYRAKWWSQDESPATHSSEWAVWADQGACGGTTPPPTDPTTPPPDNPPPDNPPPGGTKMASAPYLYPGWGSPPDAPELMRQTGIRAFTIAFVLANGCNPVWDGGGALTSAPHFTTINAIKAAGGSVVPSIGGWQGNKLGPNCSTPQALAGAYQKVIDTLGLSAIDIDIENTDEFENYTVADRIVDALAIIKRNNPNVKTIITFGTTPTGPNVHGIRLIQQAKAKNANIDIFTQMPFDFTPATGDIYNATVGASEGLKNQLKSTFGWSDQQAYAHMGISGMNGMSDQREITTPQTWSRILDYAKEKGLARFTYWAVNRDRECTDDSSSAVSHCSTIDQPMWEFTRISAGF